MIMGGKRYPRPIEFEVTESGCFNCTSHRYNTNGYPQLKVNNKKKLISRLTYEQCFGEIPDGIFVCHTCDNPHCINPEHLFLGTHTDNMRDKCVKGRHGMQKLTVDQLDKIRELLTEGKLRHWQIANLFGISRSRISTLRGKWGLECQLD